MDLARMAGLRLDPWQEYVLEHALAEKPDGRWAAFEVGVVVPRQNGKGALLEAMELAGLFLLGEQLIIHSAHQFDTSLEGFNRLLARIEDNPEFSRRIARNGIKRSHGEEGIHLTTGQRIRFRTRTKGGGRGFSCDRLILDEAMILPLSAHGALLPTLSARENPQVVYTGSAVDQNVHEHGIVLTRVRNRALKGDAQGLAYFEWSAEGDVLGHDAEDRASWARANPGLGIRIGTDHVALEQQSMDPRTFAVERLGIGDWPDLDASDADGIGLEAWLALEDVDSQPEGPLWLSFDVTPDRSHAAICVAGHRSDRLGHVEYAEHRPGTGWVPERLAEMSRDHHVAEIRYHKNSPAAALVKKCEQAGVKVEAVSDADYAQACGDMFDAVRDGTFRHIGQQKLTDAVRGARYRPMGDARAWSRKSSAVDISPLVGCTIARWCATNALSVYEDRGVLVI